MAVSLKIGYFRCSLVPLALLLSLCAGAVARADSIKVLPTRDDPRFVDMRIQMQEMVNILGFHVVNRFCVIASQEVGSPYPLGAYIFWLTQNKFIDWDYGTDLSFGLTDYYDMTRDVVPDRKFPGSQYFTRSFVAAVLKDCRKGGDAYTIRKTADGWVRIDHFKQFESVKAQLKFLADRDGTRKINDFCVIGQKDGVFLGAYVYWRTEDRLIFWLPGPYDDVDQFSVADMPLDIDMKRRLRIREDGVDYGDEMQQSYAETVVRACYRFGRDFVFAKSE